MILFFKIKDDRLFFKSVVFLFVCVVTSAATLMLQSDNVTM